MIYLISDLHLEEKRPDITEAFYKFLDKIKPDATELYILGDFFESWIGDDENTPLQQDVKAHLKALSSNNIKLCIMHGNRDFLIGERFCDEISATLLADPSVVDLADHKVLLMHGDSLCTKDASYMKFRQMVRNPAFLATFAARPLEDRRTTARQLRELSQANNQGKSMEIMDVTPEEVTTEMSKHNVDLMIHGHTHRPNIHDISVDDKPAKRYVLGDWDKHAWYIQIDKDSITLNHINFSDLS